MFNYLCVGCPLLDSSFFKYQVFSLCFICGQGNEYACSNHINLHLQIWYSLYWIIILILGRTGTAICSWLIASGQFEQAQVLLLSSIGFFVFFFFLILYKHYFLEKWLLLNGGNLYFKLIIYNLLLLSLWILSIFVSTIITSYHLLSLLLPGSPT